MNNLIIYLNKQTKNGYTSKEITEICITTLSEISKDIIQPDVLNDFLTPLLTLYDSKTINNEVEKNQVFIATLKRFGKNEFLNNPILRNNLFKLCKYDKVVEEDGNKYYRLLSILLVNIDAHFEALKKYKHNKKYGTQIEKGISSSHSTSNEKIVAKRQNSLKESIELNPHDKVAENSLSIIDKFIKNPYEVNLVINQTTMLFSQNDLPSLTEDQYQTLHSTGKYLDCDKYISSENVFYESLAATISHYYNAKSYYQKSLSVEQKISNQELSEVITAIVQHIFDCDFTISAKKLKSYIQIRCMYGNILPLYEFTTKSNIKIHPMLVDNTENNLFFEEFYKALQGKFPQKSTS